MSGTPAPGEAGREALAQQMHDILAHWTLLDGENVTATDADLMVNDLLNGPLASLLSASPASETPGPGEGSQRFGVTVTPADEAALQSSLDAVTDAERRAGPGEGDLRGETITGLGAEIGRLRHELAATAGAERRGYEIQQHYIRQRDAAVEQRILAEKKVARAQLDAQSIHDATAVVPAGDDKAAWVALGRIEGRTTRLLAALADPEADRG